MTESYIGMGVTPGDVAAWHATPSGSMLDHNLEYATSLSSTAPVYHTDTRMPDGRLGLVVDPGSVCNLSGGNWALEVAKEGLKNIRKPDQKKHNHPLQVSGVGNSSQQATHNVVLPICLSQVDGNTVSGTFEAPSVTGSNLPGLLGLKSMNDHQAVLDVNTNKLYFMGPGNYDSGSIMPTGTEEYQLEIAPSVHLLVLVGNYEAYDQREMEGSLTLDSQHVALHTQVRLE